jgi:hypothetical protein
MMARVLTKLRIDEVSAVDAAAGDGVKIVLMKRMYPADTLKAFPNSTSFNAVLARMEAEELAKVDDDAGDRNAGGGGASDHHASKVADLLVEAGKYPHRAAALDHILHSASGQALLSRMKKAADQPKDNTMSTSLGDILKTYGATRICKHIADTGRTGYSEVAFVSALTKYAAEQHPELRPDVAFSKLFETEEFVRRAISVAKSASDTNYRPIVDFRTVTPADFQPQVISGGAWRDEADSEQAMKQLAEIGRKMAPTATPAKQFDVAISDPKNAELAQRAHQRPVATTFFPMPR